MTKVRATARLQLHKDFRFGDAVPLLDYYAKLGVSHIYVSPILKARPGSIHGYDVIDHTEINPELGGEPAFRRFVGALRALGLGLIVDIVPNHMCVSDSGNRWWADILEWGPDSPYAGFFDIDWHPADIALRNKVHMPFLGKPYGAALAEGELALRFDAGSGTFHFAYFDHRFPVSPRSEGLLLGAAASSRLTAIADGLASAMTSSEPRVRVAELRAALAEAARAPDVAHDIDRILAALDVSKGGAAALHRLIEEQHYRLAWWRTAADEINWRRFFDISDLAGLRVERDDVFEATHALIFKLYALGLIDGVRVDHVDGLADPRAYCRKLRRALDALRARRPDGAEPPYIVVEKILGSSETLRTEWQVDGTTGYDFMNEVAGVLHDPRGEMPLTTLWTDLTGRRADFRAVAQDARRLILDENLNSERDKTARALHGLARNDPATRDYTFAALRHALTELLVNFPVYRTYATVEGRDDADRAIFEEAVSRTRPILPEADRPILDLIDAWLGGVPERTRGGRALQRRAIVSFQQLTSALMAKSVEDTAFYRYGRLISRNEVGSDPAEFALARDAFHAAAARRGRDFPKAMLATATHDHKRGEDARLRIAALSEIPDAWREAVRHWMRLNAPYRASLADGVAPEPGDEIMLYQTLIGAWPLVVDLTDVSWIGGLRDRILGWQMKAIREAKRRSRWIAPDEAYEAAAQQFVRDILDPEKSHALLSELGRFVDAIAPAAAVSSLTQTFLRLAVPGVPDLYQGTEFWDLSLVDPDNRRPVDYTSRIAALGRYGDLERVVRDWRSGHIKQFLIGRMLAAREKNPRLFAEGDYRPLIAEGEAAEHVVAFSRNLSDTGETSVAIATRFALRRMGDADLPLLPAAAWGATSIALPGFRFRDLFSGEIVESPEEPVPLARLLARFPVAFLIAEETGAR